MRVNYQFHVPHIEWCNREVQVLECLDWALQRGCSRSGLVAKYMIVYYEQECCCFPMSGKQCQTIAVISKKTLELSTAL